MFITKILRKRSRQPTYSVYIDEAMAFNLSQDVLVKFGLRAGDEITEKTIEHIVTSEAMTRAQAIAINYLSYRPRSSKEISDHLVRKGFSSDLSTKVVQNLRELNMVDDLEFARVFVRDRKQRKPMGKALLRRLLHEKGIPLHMVEQVLRENISDEEQQRAAEQLAAKRLRVANNSFAKLTPARRRKRLHDYLLRRGFSNEIATKTVRSVLS